MLTKSTTLPYRMFAVDLDDTLLGPDKKISAENIAAVKRLTGMGAQVVLASGRIYQQIVPHYNTLELQTPVVSSDGTCVLFPTGKIFREDHLPRAIADSIMHEGLRLGMTVIAYLHDGVHVLLKSHWTREMDYHRVELGHHFFESSLDSLDGKSIFKVLCAGPPHDILNISQLVWEKFGRTVKGAQITRELIDFSLATATKATGLNTIARYYGLARNDVVAFGDANNDIEMLEWAGLGVAMPHATSGAKLAADWVLPPCPRETAFALAIETLLNATVAA